MKRVDSYKSSNNLYFIKEISKKTNPFISKTKSNQQINNKTNIINQNNKDCNNTSEEKSYYINTLINNETNNEINKESPLFKAIYMQNINIIKELLEKGEKPNISFIDGITPLHIAINKKNEKIIEYLLKYNANPNSKTIIEGKTPVHYAIINNSNEKIISLLLEYGGSFNILDNNNKSPMDYINNLDTFNIINNLLNGKKKNNIIEISNDDFSSLLKIFETISTENDIIINNNTIYTDSSEKKYNKKNYDNDLNKDYFINNESNNLKKNLIDSYESSSELKSISKENINPNNCDSLSSSINIQKIKINFEKSQQDISKKITKRRTKSTLSELIQKNKENISLSIKSDINLSNFIRINK